MLGSFNDDGGDERNGSIGSFPAVLFLHGKHQAETLAV